MRKFLITSCILALSLGLSAQVRFGAHAGVTFSEMRVKVADESETSDMGVGFLLGGTVEYMFSQYLGLVPELRYGLFNHQLNDITSLRYYDLQLPVNLKAKVSSIGKTDHVYLLLGPYFNYSISGQMKQGPVSVDVFSYGLSSSIFKRFGTGLNVGLGIEYNSFLIEVACQSEVSNRMKSVQLNSKEEEYKTTYKSRIYTISLGYFF